MLNTSVPEHIIFLISVTSIGNNYYLVVLLILFIELEDIAIKLRLSARIMIVNWLKGMDSDFYWTYFF